VSTGPIVGRIMLVAFEGWNDAGEAASTAVRRVIEACELEPFDEIEPDDFLDFTFARPVLRRLEDGTRALSWPATIAYAPTRSSEREAIVDDVDLSVSTGAEGELFALLGKTVVLVTHDVAEAAYLGDTLVLMRNGRVVQQGSVRELLDAPAEPFVGQFLHAQRTLEDAQ